MTTTAERPLASEFSNAKTLEDWLSLRLKVGDVEDPAGMVRDLIDSFPENKADKAQERGIALWLAGRHSEALESFEKAKGNAANAWFRGCCLRELGRTADADEAFAEAEKAGEVQGTFGRAELAIADGRIPDAHDLLKGAGKKADESPDYWYLLGLIADYNGLTTDAIDHYDKALDREVNHPGALFRIACHADRVGDDDMALAHFETLRDSTPLHVNTLINLGIQYEDREKYHHAAECYRTVLKRFPNHPRARLFLKDTIASMDMYYDEAAEQQRNEVQQLLGTPVTEFELSVRSRNCLARMKIETLGDLIQKSEQELLAYKNFGETSLQEIKSILARKNLRLGMQPGEEIQLINEQPQEARDEVLNKPITDLNFSVRVRKVMEKLNILTLGDLTRTRESQLTSLKNFGKTSLAELKKKLAEHGLSLSAD